MTPVIINCMDCGKCCVNPNLIPVLFPHELNKGYQTESRSFEGVEFQTVAKKPDGQCVYYEGGMCKVQERKPLECQLYPLITDLGDTLPRFIVDTNLCPADKMAKALFSPGVIYQMLTAIRVDPKWREAFQKLKA